MTWSSVSKVCLGARKVCAWQAARDTFPFQTENALELRGIKLLSDTKCCVDLAM